jgi:hypothetical protein
MKKFKLNKQRLNLRNLTTPLLALSLMAGCAGLFGGSVSAASVTNTVSLDAAHPSIPMSDFRNIMVAPTNSSDWSSYVIEAGSAAYFSMDSVANPCTVTPVDLSLSISITPSSNINGSMAAGMVIGIYDLATTNALSQSSMDLNGSSDNDFSTKSSTVSLSAATIQNIGFGIYSEGSTIGGESSQIHSFTYTLTYPDNMPDCTYPATNTPPTISPASTNHPLHHSLKLHCSPRP